jgi:hypothetical protein
MADCEENQHNLILCQASANKGPTVFWRALGDRILPIMLIKSGSASKNLSQAFLQLKMSPWKQQTLGQAYEVFIKPCTQLQSY